jgi:hypothetical protein
VADLGAEGWAEGDDDLELVASLGGADLLQPD